MDGQVYYEDNNTTCFNISISTVNETIRKVFPALRNCSIAGILLLVPTLILQLFFICRYKSTFLHRQFIYTTVVMILLNVIFVVYEGSLTSNGCPWFYLSLLILNVYLNYVKMLQMTTIHLLLLYQLCKYMETRTTQRLQTLCCNIRLRLWHEVMIVCIQLGLPLILNIAEIVVTSKITKDLYNREMINVLNIVFDTLLAVNILLGMICIVLLVSWFYILWKRKLLKSKAKFVCTQMGHIFFVLAVFFIFNLLLAVYLIVSGLLFINTVLDAIQTFPPVSFGVYILISLQNLRKKTSTKAQVFATNLRTNPPSTRVSLPTDTAEHAPNFLSPSTAEPSEMTLLMNSYCMITHTNIN